MITLFRRYPYIKNYYVYTVIGQVIVCVVTFIAVTKHDYCVLYTAGETDLPF